MTAEGAPLKGALWAAERGMYVHPLDHPDTPECTGAHSEKFPCDGQRGKHPRTRWKDASTTDPEQIKAWAADGPTNFGIDTGKSGKTVFDEDKAGELQRYIEDHPEGFADVSWGSLLVKTGKGTHLYYNGNGLKNRARIPGYEIDVRGTGGYVVCPGSKHASGVTYELLNPTQAIRPVPAAFVKAALSKAEDKAPGDFLMRGGDGFNWNTVLEDAAQAGKPGTEGSQREFLISALGSMWERGTPWEIGRVVAQEIAARFVQYKDTEWSEDLVDGIVSETYDKWSTGDEETTEDTAVDAMVAKLLDSKGLDDLPLPSYLIKGWLTERMSNRLNGQPNTGKSLVALDWAGCIGTGTPWYGHSVRQGLVIYVIAEGAEGFKKRKKAWELHYGKDMTGVMFYPEPIQVLGRSNGDLAASKEWKVFREVCRRLSPALVVLDTQRRVLVAAKENENSDLTKAVDVLDELRRTFKLAYLLVHHPPKNGNGGSGGGAMWGAVNTEFETSKKGRGLSAEFALENTKEKDDEDGAGMAFCLRQYDTGWVDEDLKPFTSVVLVPAEETGLMAPTKESNVQRVIRELDEAGAPADSIRGTKAWLAVHEVEIKCKTDDFGTAVKARKLRVNPPAPLLKERGAGVQGGVYPW
ncbi:AAA family ATPase [Streptomyces sp. NPDC020747]|uniref:AAA family ATPase n=1 Tax=Streptomyces sp. NPDC020747 TaxID=3365086 RepID=UPI0037B62B6F